jgi:hypothetical protein
MYIYVTDIAEVERGHPGQLRGISDLPRWGGQNRKNRDSARTWRAIALHFGALILVPIFVGLTLLPRCRVSRFRFGTCGHIGVKFYNCDPKL